MSTMLGLVAVRAGVRGSARTGAFASGRRRSAGPQGLGSGVVGACHLHGGGGGGPMTTLGADALDLLRVSSLCPPTMTNDDDAGGGGGGGGDDEGVIMHWMKTEGDPIQRGDVLCEIQTGKAVAALEVDERETLLKTQQPGDEKSASINTLIGTWENLTAGLMVENGVLRKDVNVPVAAVLLATGARRLSARSAPPASSFSSSSSSSAPSSPAGSSAGGASTIKPPAGASAARANLIGPAVKLLLTTHGLDASQVPASGPHNVLLKGDVLRFIESGGAARLTQPGTATAAPVPRPVAPPARAATPLAKTAPAVGSMQTPPQKAARPPPPPTGPPEEPPFRDFDLTNMRRAIAKRLSLSKSTVPHSYASIDVSVGAILDARKRLAEEGTKISVNDFVVKAVALALKKVPQMNVRWDSAAKKAKRLDQVDISVAVATDNGLITPIVTEADIRTVGDIGGVIRELAGRARENKLKPHEFEGGSFSVSNLGMFGITEFTAVINPPQAAIMAVGGGRLVLKADRALDTLMTVTVSFDARAISDNDAADFLEQFRLYMETPDKMLAS